jgi:hypothetical protein
VCVDIITSIVLSHLTVPSCALTISPVVESRGCTLLIVTLAPTCTVPATTTIIIIIAFPCVLQRMVNTERLQRSVAEQLMLDAVAGFSRARCPSRGALARLNELVGQLTRNMVRGVLVHDRQASHLGK